MLITRCFCNSNYGKMRFFLSYFFWKGYYKDSWQNFAENHQFKNLRQHRWLVYHNFIFNIVVRKKRQSLLKTWINDRKREKSESISITPRLDVLKFANMKVPKKSECPTVAILKYWALKLYLLKPRRYDGDCYVRKLIVHFK